jgi:hypothetical protein
MVRGAKTSVARSPDTGLTGACLKYREIKSAVIRVMGKGTKKTARHPYMSNKYPAISGPIKPLA